MDGAELVNHLEDGFLSDPVYVVVNGKEYPVKRVVSGWYKTRIFVIEESM